MSQTDLPSDSVPSLRPTARPLAVVLLSGGMDSLTTAGVALREGFDLAAIHFNYGQRTEKAELRAFQRIAGRLGIPRERRLVVHTNFFTLVGASALTSQEIAVPEADLDSTLIPPTYVPFRNAVLLSMAVGWAEALGARHVYYGAVSQDSSGYPDCRPAFVEAFNRLAREGTKPGSGIEVRAPLVDLTKAEIVKLALYLGLPLELSWSCYSRNDVACGTCDSCALRLRGFEQAGMRDPIPYAKPERKLSPEERREAVRKLATLMRALTRSA
jgi:7-cyano-7-deazaguanine synthase